MDDKRRPRQAHNPKQFARANEPSTWGTYEEARAAQQGHGLAGIAFVFGDGWVGIDLDACRDPETGRIAPWALEVLRNFSRTYVEISVSGYGLHVILRGRLPNAKSCPTKKLKGVESYGNKQPEIALRISNGMLTLTGRVLRARLKVLQLDDELAEFHRKHFAQTKTTLPVPATNVPGVGKELQKLIDECVNAEDRSAADFRLLCELLRLGRFKDDAWALVATVGKFAEGGRRYFDHTWHNALKSVGLANGYRVSGSTISYPLPVILERLYELTGNWPRRIGDVLFVHAEGSEPDYLKNPAALFGWLHRVIIYLLWFACARCVTKEELFRELQRTAIAYLGIETIPHVPPFGDTYYALGKLKSGGGMWLNKLIDRFNPATPLDRLLILALFITPLWGGPGGARPMFVVIADGRGKGKTTLVQFVAQLYGGCIEIRKDENVEVITQRLLTPGSLSIRIVFLDNLKTFNFSWAALEALITTPAVSGKRMFHADATRPNRILYVVTVNEASFSTDFAQRSVFVRLGEPDRSGDWHQETRRLIDEHRDEIFADIAELLSGPSVELPVYTRWAEWERDVLAKLPGAADAQRLITERQQEVDVEGQAAGLVEQHVREVLARHGYSPDTQRIRIPSTKLVDWFNQATGRDEKVFHGSKILGQMCSEGQLKRLAKDRAHKTKRAFIWTGSNAAQAPVIDFVPKPPRRSPHA